MFTCAMCRQQWNSEPSRKNAAGSFCESCHNEITRRVKNSVRCRYITRTKLVLKKGFCNWCGCEIKDGNRRGQKQTICKTCDNGQEWLLKCIRRSEWPARYTERVNRREVKRRDEIAQQEKIALASKLQEQKQLFDQLINSSQTSVEKIEVKPNQELETRMDAIEALLKNLNKALGIQLQ